MDTVKNAANYVSDKTSEVLNSASKETNKEVAKDSNVSIGNRAEAGKDYLKDSVNEVSFDLSHIPPPQLKHDTNILFLLQQKDKASAEGNKQKATH